MQNKLPGAWPSASQPERWLEYGWPVSRITSTARTTRRRFAQAINVGGQAGVFQEGGGEGAGKGGLFLVHFLENLVHEFKALVLVGDFAVHVGAVQDHMKVVARREKRLGRILAPVFGIEVKAEDEVGLDGFIDQGGAGPDLGSAVEELFGQGEDLCCRGPRHETGSVFPQVPGAQFGDWFVG